MLGIAGLACSKKNDDPAPKTKTELLTTGLWKISAATVTPALLSQTNLYTSMDACEKDNIVKYNTNGTTTTDEGATKCDATDPQTEMGTWVFNTDQTIITKHDGTNDPTSYKVVELTATTFKISFTESGYTYTLTAVHP